MIKVSDTTNELEFSGDESEVEKQNRQEIENFSKNLEEQKDTYRRGIHKPG